MSQKPLHRDPDAAARPATPAPDVVKMTFNLPRATRQRWKQAALLREMTVTDLIVEAVEAHLS